MSEFNFDFKQAIEKVITQNTELISQNLMNVVPSDGEVKDFGEFIGEIGSAIVLTSSQISTAVLKLYHQALIEHLDSNYQKR